MKLIPAMLALLAAATLVKSDCRLGNGENYRGLKATTKSGRKCQPWKNNPGLWTPDRRPELRSNYCRNPSGGSEPWCYWNPAYGSSGWEYCGVRKCQGRRLIAMGNGEPRWSTDSERGYRPEFAFNASLAYGVGCAGYRAIADEYDAPYPIKIWYEFPSMYVPVRVAFRRGHPSALETPRTWQFIGSTAEGCERDSTWKPLCGKMVGDGVNDNGRGSLTRSDAENEVGCDVPIDAQEPFKCLGISVYSNYNYELNPSDHAICVGSMRFWETMLF